MGAQQLQVLDVVLAAGTLRDDVVNLQLAKGELATTGAAAGILLAEQDVLVLAISDGRVYIGANRVALDF